MSGDRRCRPYVPAAGRPTQWPGLAAAVEAVLSPHLVHRRIEPTGSLLASREYQDPLILRSRMRRARACGGPPRCVSAPGRQSPAANERQRPTGPMTCALTRACGRGAAFAQHSTLALSAPPLKRCNTRTARADLNSSDYATSFGLRSDRPGGASRRETSQGRGIWRRSTQGSNPARQN